MICASTPLLDDSPLFNDFRFEFSFPDFWNINVNAGVINLYFFGWCSIQFRGISLTFFICDIICDFILKDLLNRIFYHSLDKSIWTSDILHGTALRKFLLIIKSLMSYPFPSQNLFTNLSHLRAVLSIIMIPIQKRGVSNNLQVIHSLFDTPFLFARLLFKHV